MFQKETTKEEIMKAKKIVTLMVASAMVCGMFGAGKTSGTF